MNGASPQMKFKKPPVKEVQKSQRWTYDRALFSEEGPYFEALRSAQLLIQERRGNVRDEQWDQFRTLLVHECEMAKVWRNLWDNKDDPQRAQSEWINGSRESLQEMKKVIQIIKQKDERHGYDLRDAFFRSAQIAMSPAEEKTAIMPDPNLEEGGFELPTGGRVAQNVEIQLLSRLFNGRFSDWLDALDNELSSLHKGFSLGRRIGPMFVSPAIPESSILKRDATQLAILALVGRLRKAFTLASRGAGHRLPNYNSLGGEMPANPVAAWKVIHQFIQAAFEGDNIDIDLPALKQRWSAATKGRTLYFSSWPLPVKRQGNG